MLATEAVFSVPPSSETKIYEVTNEQEARRNKEKIKICGP
jgi:hypothetical protein